VDIRSDAVSLDEIERGFRLEAYLARLNEGYGDDLSPAEVLAVEDLAAASS
jgi:hypothetical protein